MGVHVSYGVVPVRSGLEGEAQRLGDVPRHDEAVRARVARRAAGPGDDTLEPQAGGLEQRRSARTAARSRPERATSPATTVAGRTGRSRRLDASATATARSAAGSSIRRPPATLTYTSWLAGFRPAWRARTAMSISTRFTSIPVVARRGDPYPAGAHRARISTASGRVPSSAIVIAAPALVPRPTRGRSGSGPRPPHAVAAHLEHADLVGGSEAVLRRAQQPRRAEALTLEVDHRVDEVLERPGPATVPSFVTWPTRAIDVSLDFAASASRAATSRTCPTLPAGPASSRSSASGRCRPRPARARRPRSRRARSRARSSPPAGGHRPPRRCAPPGRGPAPADSSPVM